MATNPTPQRKHFAALGQPHHASVAACAASFERLARQYDPRHRPVAEQGLWLDYQNAIDESLALIVDAARWDGRAA